MEINPALLFRTQRETHTNAFRPGKIPPPYRVSYSVTLLGGKRNGET